MVASVVYDLTLPKLVAAIIRGISGVVVNGLGHLFAKEFGDQAYFVAMTSISRFFFCAIHSPSHFSDCSSW